MNPSPITNRFPISLLERIQGRGLLAVLASGLLLAACSHAAAGTDTSSSEGSDAAADATDDDAPTDVATTDVADDSGASDAGSDIAKAEVAVDVLPDVPEVTWECTQDNDCFSKMNPICQTISCVDHVCGKPVLKTGANVCCLPADCPAQLGSIPSCNTAIGQCEYKVDSTYCPGKEYPLPKVGFESAGNIGGFTTKVTTSAANSTVNWQVSAKRAHSGKASLYFGNECGNYNTSASAATSCQATGAAAKVAGTLTSPELVLPKDVKTGQVKPAMLHYWVWIDAEPMFLTGNSTLAGTSCTGCALDQTCVNLGTGSKDTCLTEKDTLNVAVNGAIVQPTVVWSSAKIGKTTQGDPNNVSGWQHRVINLAGFGASATVTWTFNSVDGVNNDYEGVYIDDVTVETLCATAATTCDSATACAGDASNLCAINACTFYDNVTNQGYCFADQKPGCCAGQADCDDANACTIDSCAQPAGVATGNCSNVPDASNPQCCLASNLFAEGYENGISAWKNIGSNSTTVFWRVNPTGGTTGSKSLVFTDSTYASYDDPKLTGGGPKGTICSPEVQLQSGTLYDVAKFQLNLITEWCGQPPPYTNPPGSGTTCTTNAQCTKPGELCNTVLGVCALSVPLDKLTVTFSTGGQYCGVSGCSNLVSNIKTPLWSSDAIQGCSQSKYLEVDLALDQFAGKKGRVCFTFDAGDASGNGFPGASIDDFSMDVACQKKECSINTDCDVKCKPTIEKGLCQSNGLCGACAPSGICKQDADCDDGDKCTTDTCVQGVCANALTAGCCAEKSEVDNESFEGSKGTTLPTGWVAAFATAAVSITGDPYDQTLKWHISADNFFGTTGQYSLYFGNTLGNYDAGSLKVPYGLVTTGAQAIPVNGTTILSFHLNLSTEWDAPAVFSVPSMQGTPFAVDRLRVGFVDAANPTNITWAWSSYDISGTTNGQWTAVAVEVPAALAGKSVKIAWEFDAGNPKNNNHIGPYVDGVNLWTTCTAPVCVTDALCAPPLPDPCKSYICKFDEPNKAFSCDTPFKAGPGCCQPTSPLPAVSFESALISPMTPSADPGILTHWQVVNHKYLNGKYEVYFGNPKVWNYDDPNGTCGAVKSELDSPVLKIGTNTKQTAQLQFSIWADIEPPQGKFQTEHFKVSVLHGGKTDLIWDATDPVTGLKAGQFKTKQNIVKSLQAYQGLNINILFQFDSGDCTLNDKFEGIYLDDIQVTEPCTP